MPILWQKSYSKETLIPYLSTMTPLAGLRPFIYEDGRARGMRGVDGWTGGGLRFTLWPDRALDIGLVWFNDCPVSWMHPALGSPTYYEPANDGWLRTFGGGLLTTCGLTHFGAPDAWDGQAYGQHGRIAHQPAQNVRLWQEWRGENYVLIVEGEIRQSVLFGENLLLRRRIETALGRMDLQLTDTVTNESSRPTPLALLYHCNIGFPIVSPNSKLIVDDTHLEPRDAAAAQGLDQRTTFEPPSVGYQEQVFFHTPKVDPQGYATATLFNPELQLGIQLRWQAETMPTLTQWKMMGQKEYVCGLEPATHAMGPRKALAEKGLPQILAPGETRHYALQLRIIDHI